MYLLTGSECCKILKASLLWNMTPCILVRLYQRFRGICFVYYQGYFSSLIVETAGYSDGSVQFYKLHRVTFKIYYNAMKIISLTNKTLFIERL